ncbi:prostatic spermine-binding protein-like [Psammomys obesus]|uniref:prostatic spermine-binding protein-like n=1 Tax=Psammomys obesus TaxID=48139 RepID=UPI0024533D08|nr:prostatic spermine-binding protein-like [Psammomys obesus]
MAEWHQGIKGQAKELRPHSTASDLCPKPSAAMLLLVTLALLASSTCGAQNNKYFYIRGEDQGELRGVRVFLGHMSAINGIQLLIGEEWSLVYGSPTRKEQTFLLKNGEHVIAAETNNGLCIRYLGLWTNYRRRATLGMRKGFFLRDPGHPGKHLLTMDGKYLPGYCITELGFKWGHGPEDLTSETPEQPSPDISKEEDKDEKDASNGEDGDKDGEDGDKGGEEAVNHDKEADKGGEEAVNHDKEADKGGEEAVNHDNKEADKSDKDESNEEANPSDNKKACEDGSEDNSDQNKDNEEASNDGSEEAEKDDQKDNDKEDEGDEGADNEDSKETCKDGSEDKSN